MKLACSSSIIGVSDFFFCVFFSLICKYSVIVIIVTLYHVARIFPIFLIFSIVFLSSEDCNCYCSVFKCTDSSSVISIPLVSPYFGLFNFRYWYFSQLKFSIWFFFYIVSIFLLRVSLFICSEHSVLYFIEYSYNICFKVLIQ